MNKLTVIRVAVPSGVLNQCAITPEELSTAISHAIRDLRHPVTGEPVQLPIAPVVDVTDESAPKVHY
jgi:hypothetical protein